MHSWSFVTVTSLWARRPPRTFRNLNLALVVRYFATQEMFRMTLISESPERVGHCGPTEQPTDMAT
jgi:hypothetical protein